MVLKMIARYHLYFIKYFQEFNLIEQHWELLNHFSCHKTMILLLYDISLKDLYMSTNCKRSRCLFQGYNEYPYIRHKASFSRGGGWVE